MKTTAAQLATSIKADETLLMWARTSIRYNTGREHQASDFLSKLRAHGVDLASVADMANVKGALTQIAKEDRNN